MMRRLDRTNLRTLSEVAPPGFKGTVRAMKAHGHTGKGKGKIDNPYALAWHMKNKGDKPHYKDQKSSKRGKPVKFKKYQDEKRESTSTFDSVILERELTTKGRNQIKKINFAIPEKSPGAGSYPIHDISHARNALARVAQHGSPSEQAQVKRAVFSRYPSLKDNKEETMHSIFDNIIQEKELPDSFKKNIGKWKVKGEENPDAKKKGIDYEGAEDDDEENDDKPDFLKRDKGDEMGGCNESIFDALVQGSGRSSMFDDIVESSNSSLFDALVESTNTSTEANWEHRMARTLTLTDELVSIRGSYKK